MKSTKSTYYSLLLMICIALCCNYQVLNGQEVDSTHVSMGATDEFKEEQDTLKKVELAPLDIEDSRGLYILTADKQMQLRIMGSIRFLVLTDFVNNPVKKTFNSYFIPFEDRITIPTYHSSLSPSRFGLEVVRKLKKDNLFTRLEMDFNGGYEGKFRIRHAYGKYGKFLVGQSWSLFANVSAYPASVNDDGPTGSVIIRTPQVRYTNTTSNGLRYAFALEYSKPDVKLNEFSSVNTTTLQYIPDITGRLEKEGDFGHVQLSGVINTLTVVSEQKKPTNIFGLGASLSGTFDFTSSSILYQATYGKSITQFITTFQGTGNDALINPETSEIMPSLALGGYIGYDHRFTDDISANMVFGYSSLENHTFQSEDAYSHSYSLSMNGFWKIIEGAKLGVEYMYANRTNFGGLNAGASRVSLLLYYDF